jgi:hypothetical protein
METNIKYVIKIINYHNNKLLNIITYNNPYDTLISYWQIIQQRTDEPIIVQVAINDIVKKSYVITAIYDDRIRMIKDEPLSIYNINTILKYLNDNNIKITRQSLHTYIKHHLELYVDYFISTTVALTDLGVKKILTKYKNQN